MRERKWKARPQLESSRYPEQNFPVISLASPGAAMLGPSFVFARTWEGERSTLSRTKSITPKVAALDSKMAVGANARNLTSRNNRSDYDDLEQSAAETIYRRSRLSLLLRLVSPPCDAQAETTSVLTAPSMLIKEVRRKISRDSKRFFVRRDLDEAEDYFTTLPPEYRHLLVDTLAHMAIESKDADCMLVGDFFERAVSKDLCSPSSFVEGFIPTAELLEDIAIDTPRAFDLMAIMLKGAKLDGERRDDRVESDRQR